MMRRLVLLAGAATAQLGAFGDNACVYLRDGVAYKSGHELENAVFGDNATKFWPRLSRSPAYDASLRPQAWLEGRLDAGPDVVSYNFQLRYFELKEKENALTIVGYEHWSWTDRRLNYTLGPGCGPTAEGWVLSAGFIPKLWQPDPYTVNDLRNARPFSPRDTVFISPGGTVTIAYLSTKHLQCDMKFQDLPDDDQKCSNPVGSYLYNADLVRIRAAKESEIPNFKGSYLGRFSLVSADFWTSDHLLERPRSVDAFSGTRARGTLTLKRR